MALFWTMIAESSFALPAFYKMFRAKYEWAGGCNVCHFSKKGELQLKINYKNLQKPIKSKVM